MVYLWSFVSNLIYSIAFSIVQIQSFVILSLVDD